MPNTIAYFDITIANEPAGRLIFELFDDVVPKVRLLQHSPVTIPVASSIEGAVVLKLGQSA